MSQATTQHLRELLAAVTAAEAEVQAAIHDKETWQNTRFNDACCARTDASHALAKAVCASLPALLDRLEAMERANESGRQALSWFLANAQKLALHDEALRATNALAALSPRPSTEE